MMTLCAHAARFTMVARRVFAVQRCTPSPMFLPCAGASRGHADVGAQRRPSRRRYAAANTRGRVGHAKELLDVMKQKSASDAKAFYDALQPRDKLDVVRLLHERRRKRWGERAATALTKYYSALFEKNYCFREEDLVEQSTLGRGPGGQATNRRMQTAIVQHAPSGLVVKFSRFPSLWLNRRAARELLHLRLEEHLLGPASRLGRSRLVRERRQRRQRCTKAYLGGKGVRMRKREAHQCRWLSILCGELPLPASAVAQFARGDVAVAAAPMTVAVLFGAECNAWWPKLKAAADSAAASAAAAAAATLGGAGGEVPLLLRCLFPAVDATSSDAERAEIAACRASEVACANVRRALTCFSELFGLRLHHVSASAPSGAPRLVLERDGLNWAEHKSRMVHDGALTPLARTCWPHVYMSVRGLELTPEAHAIVIFFKREAKASAGTPAGAWASEALRCLTDAVRRGKPAATVQPTVTVTPPTARIE